MGEERQRAVSFANRLQEVYGDDLRSAVLYGSAARGDYRPGISDLNLLVILRRAGAAELRRGSALAREWAQAGNPPPLVLGEEEWRASADVFPIEYTDIRDAHVVLVGSEPFGGVDIHWRDLRLQCEHELKSKQIRLREHFLLAAEEAEALGRLLVESFPTFLTLFRTCLRLAGQPVPRDPAAVIDAIAALTGLSAEPLHEVRRARSEGVPLSRGADDPVVLGYLDAVERTTRWLDGLAPTGGPGDTV